MGVSKHIQQLLKSNSSLFKDTVVTGWALRHMEEQSWLFNHCRVWHRLVPAPKSTVWKQDVSCCRLILYLQRAAVQLGLFHWVPSDDDGVPWAKFKSLVGPKLRHMHLHKDVCLCLLVFAQPVPVTEHPLVVFSYVCITVNQSHPGAAIRLVYSSLTLCQCTLMTNIVIRYKLISLRQLGHDLFSNEIGWWITIINWTAFPPTVVGLHRFSKRNSTKQIYKSPINPIPNSCRQGSLSVIFVWSVTLYVTFHVMNPLETVFTEDKTTIDPLWKKTVDWLFWASQPLRTDSFHYHNLNQRVQ